MGKYDDIPAGPELEALVEQRLFGAVVSPCAPGCVCKDPTAQQATWPACPSDGTVGVWRGHVRRFSANWVVGDVIDAMENRGYDFQWGAAFGWVQTVFRKDGTAHGVATGVYASRFAVICRAALAALDGEGAGSVDTSNVRTLTDALVTRLTSALTGMGATMTVDGEEFVPMLRIPVAEIRLLLDELARLRARHST